MPSRPRRLPPPRRKTHARKQSEVSTADVRAETFSDRCRNSTRNGFESAVRPAPDAARRSRAIRAARAPPARLGANASAQFPPTLRPRSQLALHDEGCNVAQRVGAIPETGNCVMRSRFELARQIERALDSQYRGIGRLAALDVLLRAFAHLLGRALNIQQVIDDLERQPQRARVCVERFDLRLARAAQTSTAANRRQEQRPGFLAVQFFELLDRLRLAFAEQIDHLPRDHPG